MAKSFTNATPEGKMMAVNVDASTETFQYEALRVLFEAQALVGSAGSGPQGYAYDVTRDGWRFLVVERGDGGGQPFTVVTNWQAGLRK